MKKEKRYLQIGERFEEKNNLFIRGNFDSLFNCYDRPSYRKENIYGYYLRLLQDNADDVERYGVASYNSMIITLEAIIKKEGKRYYIYITPSYNYYMEIENDENEGRF